MTLVTILWACQPCLQNAKHEHHLTVENHYMTHDEEAQGYYISEVRNVTTKSKIVEKHEISIGC